MTKGTSDLNYNCKFQISNMLKCSFQYVKKMEKIEESTRQMIK